MRHEDFTDEPFIRARLAEVERFIAECPATHVIDLLSWQAHKKFWLECLDRLNEQREKTCQTEN